MLLLDQYFHQLCLTSACGYNFYIIIVGMPNKQNVRLGQASITQDLFFKLRISSRNKTKSFSLIFFVCEQVAHPVGKSIYVTHLKILVYWIQFTLDCLSNIRTSHSMYFLYHHSVQWSINTPRKTPPSLFPAEPSPT